MARKAIPRVSAAASRAIAEFERARAWAGAVADAVDGWTRFVRGPDLDDHAPVVCLHPECQWHDPVVRRELLRIALHALPTSAARELRAVVRPLDDTYLARVTPATHIRDILDGRPPAQHTFFTLAFELVHVGWLRVVVDDGRGEQGMEASFLTHAMDDLLAACAALTRGEPRARVSWDGEPTEFRWLFSADRYGVATVRLLILADRSAAAPDTDGHPHLDVELPVGELVDTVAGAARALLDRVGEDGYARRWERPFPVAQLRALERWSAERVE